MFIADGTRGFSRYSSLLTLYTSVNKRRKEKRASSSPAVPLWAADSYLTWPRSTAGVSVDRFSVLGIPSLWRAVNLISSKVSGLPLNVYRKNPEGGRQVDVDHPAQWLLAHQPSPLYTPNIWLQTTIAHALLHGNSYSMILRDDFARPTELILLNPENVGLAVENGRIVYLAMVGTETRKILSENMFHLKGLGHDGLIGYSVITLLAEAFGLSIAAQRYGSTYFRNNGNSGLMIIKVPGNLDPDKAEKVRREWDKMHTGVSNAHRYAVVGANMDIQSFPMPSADSMQVLQTREFEVACGIANITGVPAFKLGVKVATAYNSINEEQRSFLLDTIDPWLRNLESEAAVKLLTENQRLRLNRFIEFDRRKLEQADDEKRTATIINLVNNGLISEAEARDELARPAFPGPDRRRITNAVTYVDMLPPVPDEAESDDEQPAEENTPVGPETGELPPGVTTDPVDGVALPRFQALLGSVLRRWVARTQKAALAASKRADWSAWLADGLSSHRRILADSLAGAVDDADRQADELLTEVREELAAVTREQVGSVFARIDPAKWAKKLTEERSGN